MREFRFLRNQLFRDKDIELHVYLQTGVPGISQESDKLLHSFPEDAASLFEEYEPETDVFAFTAELLDSDRSSAGRAGLHTGRVQISSRITGQSEDLAFGVAHFGDHNLLGGVRPYRNIETYEAMQSDLSTAFWMLGQVWAGGPSPLVKYPMEVPSREVAWARV
jgi:hypothetical protein